MNTHSDHFGKMDNTLDTIRPSDTGTLQADMSYLFGRDPSILAYGQRPLPTSESKRNLCSLYEEDPSDSRIESSSATSILLSAQTVKVYLRMKPFPRKMKLTKQEAEAYKIMNPTTLLTKLPSLDNNTSALKRPKGSTTVCRRFMFTHTFGPDTSQLQLFEQAVKQQMVDFLGGQNSTVMSYGTTNAGKSYTLQGTTSSPGIIPRGLEFVFSNINPRSTPCYKPVYHCNVMSLDSAERAYEMETKTKLLTFGSIDKNQYINAYKQMQKLLQEESPMRPSHSNDASYSVWVSFAEIYNEIVYDLLSNDCQKKRPPLKVATDNHGRPFIKGLKTICVNSGSEAYQVLMLGQYNLKVAATALNARSSRSHCIFTIKLLKYYKENSPEEVEVSTFSFCDLAGSERLKKTLNVGERLKEAQNINTSLLVLGRCLKSIWECQSAKQKQELTGPFRESKLTRLFQRALSGKEHIALVVNVNPVPNLYVETQNVLNFSAIAKKIVIEPEEVKKRRSISRFSQMVTQSIKTVTDWDTTSIVEESPPASPDKSEYIDPDDYADLQTENANLKKEIAALKCSALNRDLQIRQEMANTYTIMMKDLEATWKRRVEDAEEQQEDMLTWSVKQVEDFYEDKLSQLSRKRRRSNEDDDSEDEETNVQELKKENTHLSARIVTLKDNVKGLKEITKTLQLDKNKSEFELAMVREELKNTNKLLKEAQTDLNHDGKTTRYIQELENQLEERSTKIKNLKKFLDEAKEEYIEITSHGQKMESQLEEQHAMLMENAEKISDLEEQLEHANVCLAERICQIEVLEEKLEVHSKELIAAENKAESTENQLSKFETKNLILLEEVERLQTMVIQTEEKTLSNTQNHSDINPECPNCDNEKKKLNEIRNQSSDPKVAVSTNVEMCDAANQTCCLADNVDSVEKEIQTSLRLSDSESKKVSEIRATLDSGDQTSEIAKTEQIIQTSFVETEIEEKKCQTSFVIDERKADENLEQLKLEHNELKTQHLYENLRVKELTLELEDAQQSMEKLKKISDDNELRVADYTNSFELIQKELITVTAEKEALEKELIAANVVRKHLDTKLSSCEIEIKEFNDRLTQSQDKEQHTSESLDAYIEKTAALESKLSDTITQLEITRTKCQTEHEPKLDSLEKERRAAIERDDIKTQYLDAHRERILKLEQDLAVANELQQKIAELDDALGKSQKEKDDLQRQLDTNIERMSSLQNELQAANYKEQEKENEIASLQREIKNMIHQNTDNGESEKEMEKVMKETLKDLNATKEALTNKEQQFDQLEKSSKREIESLEMRVKTYEQNAAYVTFLQEGAESRQAENERLREINNQLKLQLLEKEHEMEAFSRNRDETITKYEGLFKTMQEDGERNKREVARFQEVFMRQATPTHSKEEIRKLKDALKSKENLLEKAQNELTKLKSSKTKKENQANTSDDEVSVSDHRPTRRRGRREAANTISEPNSEEIAVIELSGSESKRTTRRTELPPPEAPSAEKKRTRRKKLFAQTDEGCVDVEPCESDPRPPPSPLTATRNLRTRRK